MTNLIVCLGKPVLFMKDMELSMYSCVSHMVLKYCQNHSKHVLGQVSYNFNYENCGIEKRAVYPRQVAGSDSRVVLIGTVNQILAKRTLIDFISDCPRLYIVTEFNHKHLPIKLNDNDLVWQPPKDFLFHNYKNSVPSEGKTYFYCEDPKDAVQIIDQYEDLTPTESIRYLPWSRFSIVYSEEAYIKSIISGCYPFTWHPLNRLNRPLFDADCNYVGSNSFARCSDFIDVAGKCKILDYEQHRQNEIQALKNVALENMYRDFFMSSQLYATMFKFCKRRK